ncbi:hypothetical protein [Geosporobacter ferrireducens]|uniref:Uncharacterized protein n=1 Tax=Geosporobacter ferrireducens TaxID=1424294 RepID=A0A1D8GMN4_9FIRM|nr:hypothetical protein [Geosporobacter ferrireducens]AOT72183.1 hypothetical protein Gferi_23150 [Geosporobacter ferrireducens]MTI56073.1 hypothetical protein [Geosporobacter ferrireducens]
MNNREDVLQIDSDYPIRILREDPQTADVDLFIDLSNRSINLKLCSIESLGISRIQLPQVRGILIRYCKKEKNGSATIHFLRNIDLYSHIMNFEVNYAEMIINVKDAEDAVEFLLEKNKKL